MKESDVPTVGHFKDRFLPASETAIFDLIQGARRYRAIVLDRHPRQNPDRFPWDRHFSPAEALGPPAGVVERAALRIAGRSPYLEHVLRRERAAILHAHFGQLGALLLPVARRCALPLVTSFYGTDVAVFAAASAWRRRFERLWRHGDRFLALGPSMADRLVRLGAPDSRIETLPLPVDVDAFARVAPTTPGPEETLRILSCGRLLPVKGMEVLLHAAASLGGSRSIEVSIAGDGPERARLKELARQLGLGESVRFLGWVEHRELPALMARAHLFVLASRRDPVSGQIEGTPTVLLEAQAAGLPVVSTRHGDIPSIVPEEARTHALVPEGEQAALAAAIARICDQPDLWRALGRAGRAFVTRRHAKHRVVERLERVYDDCLALRQATATPPG